MSYLFKIFVSSFLVFVLFIIILFFSFFWAAYLFPPIISFVESRLSYALSYEMSMRFYLAGMILIPVICFGIYSFYKRNISYLFVFGIMLFAFIVLLPVLIFDISHSLTEEGSWIRYPTFFALSLTGLILFFISRYFNQGERLPHLKEWTWLMLSFGFVSAGIDEILAIHEGIGLFLEGAFALPHLVNDLMTIVYFIIGLLVLFLIFPTISRTIKKKSLLFGSLSFFALLVFGLSTFFDTFDTKISNILRNKAVSLAWDDYLFSDIWNIIYEPSRFFNGLEEILEYFAAVLFLSAALILFFSYLKPRLLQNRLAQTLQLKFLVIFFGLVGITLLVLPFFIRYTNYLSPLEKGQAIKIASVKNGLFHSDDLYFHPQWGVILANESELNRNKNKFFGPGVLIFKDGEIKRVSDPEERLIDIDSVTADSQAIYAANSSDGKILQYRSDTKDWEEIASRKDGLRHPEGLAILDDELFILDEEAKSVSKLKLNSDGQITKDFPDHPQWLAPEGIIFHPQLESFLITDDKSGTIFRYNFDKTLEVWAENLKNPEDITVSADGRVLVTDNGRGEILILNQSGIIEKTIRFHPLFRDLQGITLDQDNNLFIVTADSYGLASFMPSYLWMIEDW